MTLNTAIRGVQIEDVSISGTHLVATNSPTGGYFLSWNSTQSKFEWASIGSVVTNEPPVDDVNGINVDYTLLNTPQSGTVSVHLNGLLQEEGIVNDYTISGSVVTFVEAPLTGDIILFSYLFNDGFGSSMDHGGLTGLGDDDHPQYLLASGDRQLTGDWDFGSFTISGTGDIYCDDLYTSGSSLHVGDVVITESNDILTVGSDTIIDGTAEVGDHAAATVQSTVNVIYGTEDPPAASGYTEGTLYVKYID